MTKYQAFELDCEAIAEECEAEGYPAHGSNYDLRVENLRKKKQYSGRFSA